MDATPAPRRLSRWQKLAAVFGPTAIVVVFGLLAYWGTVREREERNAVIESHRVIETSQTLVARLVDAESRQRGYLLTGRERYFRPYEADRAGARAALAELRRLTGDSRSEQARIDTLGRLMESKFREMEETVRIRREQELGEAMQVVLTDRGERTMDEARRIAAALHDEETAELEERRTREARYAGTLTLILIAGTLGAGAASLLLNTLFGRYAAAQASFAETLRERTEAAETANQAKAKFLAAMSHDLRTPLNAIGGYTELLEMGIRGPVTPEQSRDLQRIRAGTRHLLAMINDILNFARLEAGRVEIRPEDVLADAVVRNLESSVLPQVAARGLEYLYEGCDPALVVRADPVKMEQILLNLLTNAIKFTEPGGRITVACAGEGGKLAVRVRDTGRGIPPEKLPGIFEPFVQVDRELTAESHQGVGLGLAISRELARAMGGDLAAESAPGRGSCFTLRLPLAPRPAPGARPPVRAAVSRDGGAPRS
ncbi:MAG: CHASE3 domain-containing protein [Gemmatimonadetes bacterium]|nr:CHASE3 domain-containing protein [Gemmatimonadota bacterium]